MVSRVIYNLNANEDFVIFLTSNSISMMKALFICQTDLANAI